MTEVSGEKGRIFNEYTQYAQVGGDGTDPCLFLVQELSDERYPVNLRKKGRRVYTCLWRH